MRKVEYKTAQERESLMKEASLKGEVFIAEENLLTGNTLTFISNEDVDIEELRLITIQTMRNECRDKIINEFYSNCLGESKKFDCEITTDQTKIMGYYFSATLLIASQPELIDTPLDKFQWKTTGELICYSWTPRQIIKLGEDMQVHITSKTRQFDLHRIWALDKKRTIKELREWEWDMQLPNV